MNSRWSVKVAQMRRPEARADAWVFDIKRAGREWGTLVDERVRSHALFQPSDHHHERWDEAIVVLEGRYWVRIGSWSRTLVPGEAGLIPADLKHESGIANNPTGVHFLVLLLSARHRTLRGREPGAVAMPPGSLAFLRAAFKMMRYAANPQNFIPLSILPEFIRSIASAPRLPAGDTCPDPIVADAIQILEQSTEAPSLAELGRSVGLTPFHLQRRFKSVTGKSPLQYARAHRLDSLAKALRDGATLPLVELAGDHGFNDMKHFRTVFARRFGMGPAAYRKNHPPAVPAHS